MIEDFFMSLFQGDIRSIVILVLSSAILYVVVKTLLDIKKKYNGFLKVLFWLSVGLTIWGLIYWPQTVFACFMAVVDVVVPVVELFFEKQVDQQPLKGYLFIIKLISYEKNQK